MLLGLATSSSTELAQRAMNASKTSHLVSRRTSPKCSGRRSRAPARAVHTGARVVSEANSGVRPVRHLQTHSGTRADRYRRRGYCPLGPDDTELGR